jgi:tRNA nucleotidyltransferase (CCA-adding enzyme)
MSVLDNSSAKLSIRLAALLHDIGKFNTKSVTETEIHFYKHEFESTNLLKIILKRLKYSNNIINDVEFMILRHMHTKNYGDELNNVKDKTIS